MPAPVRSVLLVVLACVLGAGACDRQPSSSASMDELADELEAINTKHRDQSLEQIDSEGLSLEAGAAHVNELADTIGAQRDQATGEDRLLLDVLARFAEDMKAAAQDYTTVFARYTDTGALDTTTMDSEEEILRRIDLAEDCIEANTRYRERVRQLFADQPDKIRALAAQGVPQAHIDSFLRGFTNIDSNKLDRIDAVRTTDDTIMHKSVEMLTMLHDTFGLWKVNDAGTITFDASVPQDAIHRYNAAFAELQAAAAEQIRIQREQLESQQP